MELVNGEREEGIPYQNGEEIMVKNEGGRW